MVFIVSTALSYAGLISKIEDGSHAGLRPSSTWKLSSLSFRSGVQGRHSVIRASDERTTASVRRSGLTNEECEAAAVVGNFPARPPVFSPSGPEGTPKITPLERPKRRRPKRRHRWLPALREAFQETHLFPANLVLPLIIHEGEEDIPIRAMPGCFRLGCRHGLIDEVYKARDVGIKSFALFPKIPDALKSPTGDEAYNDNGLVPHAICLLKDKFPDIAIFTDVALDPYNSDGHDGIVREDGVIMNDETVHQLCKQAVSQARAGADVVSASDMMHGGVTAIRSALDAEGFQDVSIMFCTAKYGGAFGEALDSNPRSGYMDYETVPENYQEALVALGDVAECADILLVKPAYSDVIRLLRENSALPIAAYQASDEYAMIKAGAALKVVDEEDAMMETLMSIKRAGANIILTYFARQAANFLCGTKP